MGPSVFEGIVDLVTTRCMQWRVRVEAGLARADGAGPGIGGPVSGAAAGGGLESLDLRPRVVLEAVIDVASQRPRVAYLRDVTLLEASVLVLGDPGLVESLGLGAEAGGELGADEAVGPSEDSGDPSGSADAVPDWRRVERPAPRTSPRAARARVRPFGRRTTDNGFRKRRRCAASGHRAPQERSQIGRATTGAGAVVFERAWTDDGDRRPRLSFVSGWFSGVRVGVRPALSGLTWRRQQARGQRQLPVAKSSGISAGRGGVRATRAW